MSIEKVLSGIEHVHAFTRAVSVGNPREFLQAEKEDQEMAEAANGSSRIASSAGITCICRRNSPRSMIRPDGRNCCRRWPMGRRPPGASESLGRVCSLGGQASGFGRNQAPKTDRLNQVPPWEFRKRRKSFTPRQLARILWDFAYLCWANTKLVEVSVQLAEPNKAIPIPD